MAERLVELPYAPRDAFLPFHERKQRFAIGVAHRRAGKTVACINDKIRRAILTDKSMYRAGYVAPYLKQAKDVAWEYLKHYSRPIWGRPPNESELWVELLNGARIRIYGADNAEALRGGYFDDATLDEYADMAPSVWGSIIRPMLADRRGSATFIGTPKGRNAFFQMLERAQEDPESWYWFVLRASETGLLGDAELAAARADMTPEQFEQEFECSFDAAIVGAYYGKDLAEAEREGRIGSVSYDPSTPVYTAWDLGFGDSTAIWFFQMVGPEIHVIDHYENSGQKLAHYVGVLKDRGYEYAEDFVPHDAKAHELISGRTRVEHLTDLGRDLRVVRKHRVEDGINAARLALKRCHFDRAKCGNGIEALRQYRTEFDEKTRAYKNNPRHDWTSHTADAFRYLALGWEEIAKPPKPVDALAQLVKPKTLNDVLREYELEREDD